MSVDRIGYPKKRHPIPKGVLVLEFQNIGVSVVELNFSKWNKLSEFRNLCNILSKGSNKYIQTWLYHADFVGGLAARIATDASIYQMMPYGVLIPKSKADLIETINYARESKVPLLARGGGTSQCGQTVNNAIVIDNSKYLNKCFSTDIERPSTEKSSVLSLSVNCFSCFFTSSSDIISSVQRTINL